MSYSGQPLRRFEDPKLITGQGCFVDDIHLADMLYASMLRSPHAHARIRSIDTTGARALPGVAVVLTGHDIAGVIQTIPTRAMAGEWAVDEFTPREQPVLADGKVCYVGQPVAVVVAGDRYTAEDAAELVQVYYEPLQAILDPLEAAVEGFYPIL